MNTKTIPLDYANGLIYELEKAFWDERGKGARFRMTTVGRTYFEEKCLPLFESADLDHLISVVKRVLVEAGIVGKISYSGQDRLLKIQVEGCVHRFVDQRMKDQGIEPFTCLPANLIVLSLEEKLDRPVELAEIKLEEGACQLTLIIFDQRPDIE